MVKVERGLVIRKILPLALLSAAALTGCGGDDKKEDDENSQYVVMPFVLGDTAKIDGASATTFSISKSDAAAGAGLKLKGGEAFDALYLTPQQAEHDMRTLLNHFDSTKGLDQGAWFWKTARRLDAYGRVQSGKGLQMLAGDEVGPTEAAFVASAKHAAEKPAKSFAMTAAGCPAAGDEMEVPGEKGSLTDRRGVTIPADGAEDATDFCLVYLDAPTTAGGKDKVKATVKTVLERFKKVIYKDDLAPVGGYTFKPIVAVLDINDKSKWPDPATYPAFKVAGAFIKDVGNDEYKAPVLYMASTVASPDGTDATATKVWHGTVAHEMQHAVMDYFKAHKADLGGEIAAIDEGLAHNIEDMFGYGAENFSGFAKAFLGTWANKDAGGFPILTTDEVNPTARGAAQTFWYYMISQKGGITYDGGFPASGGGLDFIATAVKSQKRGVANLAASHGGTWTDVVSGFYGALVLDGTKLADGITVDAKNKVQDTQTCTDLNGNTDKQCGMHFNGFGGLPDTRTYELTVDATPKIEDVSYYQTVPLLYTGAAVDSINYTSDAEDKTNQGVAKVKIK